MKKELVKKKKKIETRKKIWRFLRVVTIQSSLHLAQATPGVNGLQFCEQSVTFNAPKPTSF